jgi:hypothetical protein
VKRTTGSDDVMTTATFEAKIPPAGHTPGAGIAALAGQTLGAQPCQNSMTIKPDRKHARIGSMEAKILPQFKMEFVAVDRTG